MIRARQHFQSVCAIEGNTQVRVPGGIQTNTKRGLGAFIAPDKIITAQHVLDGMTTVVATNSDGETSYIVPEKTRLSPKLDLAIATLVKPIGRQVVAVPRPSDAALNAFDKGFLLSRFNRAATDAYDVAVDQAANAQPVEVRDLQGRKIYAPCMFTAPLDLKPGNSGSPVLDADGALVTLVTHVDTSNAAQILNGAVPEYKGGNFAAPWPRDVAAFVHGGGIASWAKSFIFG